MVAYGSGGASPAARTVGRRRDGRMTGCGDAREDRRREDQVTAAQWDG